MSAPVLHLLAGPNGAGKSTFVARVLEPVTHLRFVNADEIAAERWPGEEIAHAYQDSRAAAEERRRLLARGESFITETVFSHHSKVALVTQAVSLGYLVNLHVILVPADLAVRRVAERVRRGGHEVPEDKIRERYARLLKLVVDARALADRSTFYDNSTAKHPFRVVASYERGRLVGTPSWPAWTPTVLTRA
ncbi:MAG TPA: AAA family ATPase [Aeromicrobium sp.]|nr:AAA family ATPase [Aeromicrobium sp.]